MDEDNGDKDAAATEELSFWSRPRLKFTSTNG